MRVVKHEPREAKTLYNFPLLIASDDCKDRVVCLSERDMSIIWTAIELADKVHPRVFYSVIDELYQVVSDEDFNIFTDYVNSLRVTLGEWPMCNEILQQIADNSLRMAVALEGINEKTSERVTWEEMIADLENVLGIGNAFVEIVRWVGGLFPQIRAKIDFTPLVMAIWEYYTWKAPILALLTAANASLAGLAASALAEKPLSLIRTVTSVFDSVLNLNNRMYEFILGDWNWYDDIFRPIWESFISEDEGGTGGDDPNNDSDLRPIVNLQNTIVDSDTFNCAPDVTVTCGGGGGCGDLPTDGGPEGEIILPPDAAPSPGDPQSDPPPTGFDTWGAYDEYKCKVATWIFESLLGGFKWAAGLSGLGIDVGVGGLAVWVSSLLAAIRSMSSFARLLSYAFVGAEFELLFGYALVVIGSNPVAWIGIATALGTLLVLAIASVQYCNDIADLIEAEREELICDLYNASDAAAAGQLMRQRVLGHVTTVVQSWAVSIGEDIGIASIMTFYDYIWGDNRILNMLFEQDADFIARAENYEGDCSACPECEPLIWEFETSQDGWQVTTTMPACFGFSNPALAGVGVNNGILVVSGGESGNTFNGGIFIDNLDWTVQSGHGLSNSMRISVAGGLYIDAVILTDAGCRWRTMSSSFAPSMEFTGLGLNLDDMAGETIFAIYLYMNSNIGASGLIVEFENIGLYCESQ